MEKLPERRKDYPPGIDLADFAEALAESDADSQPEPEEAEAMENLPEAGVDFPENFDRSEEPGSSNRFFKWGTYGIGVLILAMIIYVVIAENWSIATKLNPGIDDMVESMGEAGFKVGAVNDLPDRSGANSAKQVVLNGHSIYIYQFSIDTDPKQKQLLDEIERAGTIRVKGEDVLAKVHGPFVLTHWQDAPYRDDLVRIYLGFGGFGTRTETEERAAADRAKGGAQSQGESADSNVESAENPSQEKAD